MTFCHLLRASSGLRRISTVYDGVVRSPDEQEGFELVPRLHPAAHDAYAVHIALREEMCGQGARGPCTEVREVTVVKQDRAWEGRGRIEDEEETASDGEAFRRVVPGARGHLDREVGHATEVGPFHVGFPPVLGDVEVDHTRECRVPLGESHKGSSDFSQRGPRIDEIPDFSLEEKPDLHRAFPCPPFHSRNHEPMRRRPPSMYSRAFPMPIRM